MKIRTHWHSIFNNSQLKEFLDLVNLVYIEKASVEEKKAAKDLMSCVTTTGTEMRIDPRRKNDENFQYARAIEAAVHDPVWRNLLDGPVSN